MGDLVEMMELAVRILLGSAILLTVALLVYLLLRRARPPVSDPLSGSPTQAARSAAFLAGSQVPKGDAPVSGQCVAPRQFDLREALNTAYKVTMSAVTLVLFAATVFTFMSATVANGLGLVGGMLAIFTVVAAVSINKLDRQRAHAAFWQDMIQVDLVQGPRVAGSTEVHHIDAELFATARRMKDSGATITAICSAMDPHYSTWGTLRQAAFRGLVKAMLQHKPAG